MTRAWFAVVTLAAAGCANYKADTDATREVWAVHVTTEAASVAGCRLIQHVDSRDASLGCGLTVQPTPEECLRYQVKRAGGDTLLMRGPAGEAYACSPAPPPAAAEPAPSVVAPAAPAPTAPPPPPVAAPSVPAPAEPVRTPAAAPSPPPEHRSPVRITSDRDGAKGCVYLGELEPGNGCGDADGEASAACAQRVRQAMGNLVVRDGGRFLVFSCSARP